MSDDSNDGHGDGWPRSGSPGRMGAGSGRVRQDDPLAELARLIDEDPFADFDRRRNESTGSNETAGNGDTREEPLHGAADVGADGDYGRDDEGAPEPAAPHDYANYVRHADSDRDFDEPAAEPDEHLAADDRGEDGDHDRLFADLSEAHQHEEAENPEPETYQPATSRFPAGYDPAAELEAELFAARDAAGDPNRNDDSRDADGEDIADYSDPVDDGDWQSRFEHPTYAAAAAGAAGAVGRATEPSHGDNYDRPSTEGGDNGTTEDWYSRESSYAGAQPTGGDAIVRAAPESYRTEPDYAESDPVYDYDDGYPPPNAREGSGSRRGLTIALALAGLVVIGGVVAFAYRGIFGDAGGGPPPVIQADSGPTKVVPEGEETADAEMQGKSVFDRVGGESSDGEARIVSREEPVFEVEGRDSQVRVIDTDGGDVGLRGSPDADPESADVDQPRRVRTVVVRPDGTIVDNPERLDTALRTSEAPDAPEATTADIDGDAESALPSSSDADGASTGTPESTAPTAADTAFVPPSPTPAPETPSQSQRQSGQPLQLFPDSPAGQPEPRVPSETEPFDLGNVQQQQQQSQQPAAQEVAQAQPPEPATPPSDVEQARFPAGSYVVQVGSTPSQDEARTAASSIQQRYGNLLTGYEPAIERADLGERGIYYRIAVGPLGEQADASSLCEELKAAGLDCFVRRN